jgi:hypothetical protein
MPIQLCGEVSGAEALADAATREPAGVVSVLTVPPDFSLCPGGMWEVFDLTRIRHADGSEWWEAKSEAGEVVWDGDHLPSWEEVADGWVMSAAPYSTPQEDGRR